MLARHKPQAPHPAPPSQRLATTPSSEQDGITVSAPEEAGITFLSRVFCEAIQRTKMNASDSLMRPSW
jgi:hypothetical protein